MCAPNELQYSDSNNPRAPNWSKFEVGGILPEFRLPSVKGCSVSAWDFKGKHNLLILNFDSARQAHWDVFWELVRRQRDFRAQNTELIAIANGPEENVRAQIGGLELPMHILCLPSTVDRENPFVHQPHIFVADRFGEIKMISEISGVVVDEVFSQALTRLELCELECPECGVPTWSA